MKQYSMSIFWSEEDSEWVAQCRQLSGITALGDTPAKAAEELTVVIKMAMEALKEQEEKKKPEESHEKDEEVPPPISYKAETSKSDQVDEA